MNWWGGWRNHEVNMTMVNQLFLSYECWSIGFPLKVGMVLTTLALPFSCVTKACRRGWSLMVACRRSSKRGFKILAPPSEMLTHKYREWQKLCHGWSVTSHDQSLGLLIGRGTFLIVSIASNMEVVRVPNHERQLFVYGAIAYLSKHSQTKQTCVKQTYSRFLQP